MQKRRSSVTKMRREITVCQVATVKTSVYETCDTTEHESSTATEEYNKHQQQKTTGEPGTVALFNNARTRDYRNDFFGNLQSSIDYGHNKYTEESDKSFQVHQEPIDKLVEKAGNLPCSKILKEAKTVLQAQDDEIMQMMKSVHNAVGKMQKTEEDFLRQWNEIN